MNNNLNLLNESNKIIKSIRKNTTIEFICYIFYVYAITILSILFKPSYITIFILVLYVLIHTLIILKNGKCKKLKDNYKKWFVSLYYIISWIFIYYGIHYIYWKRIALRPILIFTPILYFIYIKFLLYIFGCNMFLNYHYILDMLQQFLFILHDTHTTHE
jgi:hypothetical protein